MKQNEIECERKRKEKSKINTKKKKLQKYKRIQTKDNKLFDNDSLIKRKEKELNSFQKNIYKHDIIYDKTKEVGVEETPVPVPVPRNNQTIKPMKKLENNDISIQVEFELEEDNKREYNEKEINNKENDIFRINYEKNIENDDDVSVISEYLEELLEDSSVWNSISENSFSSIFNNKNCYLNHKKLNKSQFNDHISIGNDKKTSLNELSQRENSFINNNMQDNIITTMTSSSSSDHTDTSLLSIGVSYDNLDLNALIDQLERDSTSSSAPS